MQALPDLDTLPRTLVVADDPLVREGFLARLGSEAAGGAMTADDIADAVTQHEADLVLWDLGPSFGGDEAADLRDVGVPVVALSSPRGRASALLARGASGVLLRDISTPALRAALRTVLAGLVVIDPSLLDAAIVGRAEADEAPDHEDVERSLSGADALTAREVEVLELLAAGLSNKQIADRLGISTHTAKFHIGAILSKLGAGTRTEAVVKALQRGLVML